MRTTRSTNNPLRDVVLTTLLVAACGPGAPDDDVTTSSPATTTSTSASGAETSQETTLTTATPTGTGTTTPMPTTGDVTMDTSTTDTSTTEAVTSSSSGTSDGGVCIADPAQGICSESCEFWDDCCQCGGKRLKPEDQPGCVIHMGIVTAHCPWGVWNVNWDGEPLASDEWKQATQGGDVLVEILGLRCTALMAGEFEELELEMFCEVA